MTTSSSDPTLMFMKITLPLVLLLFLQACSSSVDAPGGERAGEVKDAYEFAGSIELPPLAPEDRDDLHNVFALSESIVSGGEPHSEEALAYLAGIGIRTVVSVDGKVPDAVAAKRHGLRYVHVPIRYSGISEDELLALTKTFRELEAPFYVHCFHGRHRGPAAAAVGRMVRDDVSRERAAAEMRQWCGTSGSYTGLYDVIASRPLPSAEETAAYAWDFPEAKPMEGFRESMVEVTRAHDNLKALAARDWEQGPEHPDLDALREAEILLEVFRQGAELEEVQARPEDFRGWLAESVRAGESLVDTLRASRDGVGTAGARAREALERIGGSCKACHRAYRNSR